MPKLSEVSGSQPVRLSQIQEQPGQQFKQPFGSRGYTFQAFRGSARERAATYVPNDGGQPSDRFRAGVIAARRAGDRQAERLLQAELDFAVREETDPTKSMGPLELLAAGGGAGLARMARGPAQLVGLATEQDEATARALEAPLMASGYGFTGNILANTAPFALGGPVLRAAASTPRLAAAAPALSRAASIVAPTSIRGNTALGAVAGGVLQPTVQGESRLENAGIGAGAGLLGAGAPRAIGATRNVLQGMRGAQRSAAGILREAVPDIENVLSRAVPSRTGGVTRTLAESTLDPRVVLLDRATRATGATRLTERETANMQAQVDQLSRIAGTEDDLVDAMQARSRASAPIRAEAMKAENVDVTKALASLSNAEKRLKGRDTVKGAVSRIRELISDAVQIRPGRPASQLVDSAGNPLVPATPDEAIGASVAELDNVRKTINDMLEGKWSGDTNRALAGSRELIMARDALDNVISRRVPEYNRYLKTYREMSRDVNRLQLGQELVRRVTTAGEGIAPRLKPGAFLQATQGIGSSSLKAGANRTAQAATGFRKARAADILGPEDADVIRAIREDLSRSEEVRAIAARNAGGNSATALLENQKRGLLSKMAKVPILAGNRLTSDVIENVINRMERGAQDRLVTAIADALANPERARAILARFPKDERRIASSVFGSLGIGGTVGVQTGRQEGPKPISNNAGQ